MNHRKIEQLLEQLREGCVYHTKRWSGDTFTGLGGEVDEQATDEIMNEAVGLIRELMDKKGKETK